MISLKKVVGAALVATVVAGPVLADGDAAAGERVFRKCKACHSLEEGKRMMGPSLHGVIGRKAGTLEGYKYSKAMVSFGQTWDEGTLTQYLQSPRTFVKNNKMAFIGLRKPKQINDLIAYLKENGGAQ